MKTYEITVNGRLIMIIFADNLNEARDKALQFNPVLNRVGFTVAERIRDLDEWQDEDPWDTMSRFA